MKGIFWFLSGAACFIISQPLLRLPLLEQIQQSTGFLLAYTLNPLMIGILIALSAGVFEEGFRFLFKQLVLRPNKCSFLQPLIFGLGHGLAEALILLVPALMVYSVSQLGLAFLERVLAIVLHVALSVVVWNGFQKKQRILYLLIAIAIHGFVDALIPILSPLPNFVFIIESSLAVIDVILIIYVCYSRKYYARRKNENEEIKI